MKNLKIAAAATAILAATAVGAAAQTTASTPAGTAMGTAATQGADPFFAGDVAGHTLASNWIGTNVRGAGGEDIGEVKDVIVGPDGKVVAAVLAVGGFLGVGEKDVAVNIASLTDAPSEGDEAVLMVNATKDTLEAAPAFVEPEERTALLNPALGTDSTAPAAPATGAMSTGAMAPADTMAPASGTATTTQ